MRHKTYKKSLTLVELLVALIVSSVILAAVATLVYAMSTASVSTDDTSSKQAQVRFVTLRITELIRHCKLICAAPGNDLVIWKADDNSENGKIDILELTYIEKGNNNNFIRVLEFTSCPDWLSSWFANQPFQIAVLQLNWLKTLFVGLCQETYARLIQQCSNVEFYVDDNPPNTKFVSISFDLVENDVVKHYQINAALRGWAGNLLSADGQSIVSDDD